MKGLDEQQKLALAEAQGETRAFQEQALAAAAARKALGGAEQKESYTLYITLCSHKNCFLFYR